MGQVLGQSCGGAQQSGIGRAFSLEGMLESFTPKKGVTVNLGLSAPQPSRGSPSPQVTCSASISGSDRRFPTSHCRHLEKICAALWYIEFCWI